MKNNIYIPLDAGEFGAKVFQKVKEGDKIKIHTKGGKVHTKVVKEILSHEDFDDQNEYFTVSLMSYEDQKKVDGPIKTFKKPFFCPHCHKDVNDITSIQQSQSQTFKSQNVEPHPDDSIPF
jgi:hypothetical protein